MPAYRYKAVSAGGGEASQGIIDAPSRDAAIARLQRAGHLPVSAEEVVRRSFDFSRLLKWRRGSKVNRKDVTLITRELATLAQAGLPLDHALQTLSRLNQRAAVQQLLRDLLESIQGGLSLSDAIAKQTGVFSDLYINMIRAGEASGTLNDVIKRLADYLERMSELRSYVVTAMIYPAVLFTFSILSLIVLMTFVVPEFVPLFEDTGQPLPLLTQVVFAVSSLLQRFWWGPLLLLVLAAWAVDRVLAEPAYRLRFDAWCLRLPYLNEVIKQMEIARFARTLSTATGNGVPLLNGIRLVKAVIGNHRIAEVMETVSASLEQGQSMAKPLKDSGVCPDLATQLIEIGETSGQLDAMLTKIADIYDKEVQTSIRRLLTVLEPVLILGLGGLIGVIIASVLLAVLGMNALVV